MSKNERYEIVVTYNKKPIKTAVPQDPVKDYNYNEVLLDMIGKAIEDVAEFAELERYYKYKKEKLQEHIDRLHNAATRTGRENIVTIIETGRVPRVKFDEFTPQKPNVVFYA